MAESAYVSSLTLLDENKILADLNRIAIELGLIKKINETSRIYVYYAVFARVFGTIVQTIAQYLNNLDIETTTDEALLEQLIKPFVKKRNAKVAKVILEFTRRENDESAVDVFIPRNFEVMTEGNNPIIFRTAESKILWKDSYKIKIPAYSVEFGSINNLAANTLTYFNDAYFSSVAVTNPDPAYGGRDEETAFDTRNRLSTFRYGRDGSKNHIMNILYDNGIGYYDFNVVEYWDGYGSLLVAIDIDSEQEYYDIINTIEQNKVGGIKYHYCMVNHVYANLTVTAKVTGDRMYSEYDLSDIEQTIKTAVEVYFGKQIYVGKQLSVKRLEAFVLQYLVDETFDVYEMDVEVGANKDFDIDPETGYIIINEYEKLLPNKITTVIEYNFE
jgi:uncharacterized phage protein gp47/JayE